MNQIRFKEVLKESFEILKSDKKRFAIILLIMVILGFSSDLLRGKAVSVVFNIGSFVMYIIMSISSIYLTKEYYFGNKNPKNQEIMSLVKEKFWKSLGVIILQGLLIICALIVFLVPLAALLAMIAPNLGKSVTVVAYFSVILFSLPLIAVNVMLSFSLHNLIIIGDRVVESIKNSYLLVRRNFKEAMIIGIKINLFYYVVIIALVRVKILGSFVISGFGILYMIMVTLTYLFLSKNDSE